MGASVTGGEHWPARALVRHCFDVAVDAVRPGAAMARALTPLVPRSPPWLIGVGKAAQGMTGALVQWLAAHELRPAGGIVISAERAAPPHSALVAVAGNHPIPGNDSFQAARMLGSVVRLIPADAEVHVAISGGTSSLIAGPVDGVDPSELTAAFALLLGAGLDIDEMNAARKRLTRWSAGRLAEALRGRPVHVWIISDVPGDDPAAVGSGPCSGDSWTSNAVLGMLRRRHVWEALPPTVRTALHHETLKPDAAVFDGVDVHVVASNRDAIAAAAHAAELAGCRVRAGFDPLRGDAAPMGRQVADTVLQSADSTLLVWGGETTVTVTPGSGIGGRSQELALAAAETLAQRDTGALILAAGTDGRDGTTEAAGALVDARTWARITREGRSPGADLARHDSWSALAAADALVVTGPTGTNVSDLVIAFSGWPSGAP